MAYVFKEGKMASNVLDSQLANAIAQVAVKDGSLLVLGGLVADTTYSNSGLEYDTYEASAPAAATDEVVIVDYAGISSGDIMGNHVKQGYKLYDLEVPAGEAMRVRRLSLHDKFWLGGSNFASAPTVGKYATAAASSMQHAPANSLPEAGYAIKVLVEQDLTAGMASKGKLYLCEVVQL